MKKKNEKGETVALTCSDTLYCCFRIFLFMLLTSSYLTIESYGLARSYKTRA